MQKKIDWLVKDLEEETGLLIFKVLFPMHEIWFHYQHYSDSSECSTLCFHLEYAFAFICSRAFWNLVNALEHCHAIICFPEVSHLGLPAPRWSRSCLHTGFQSHCWSWSARSGIITCWNWNQVLGSTLERVDGAGTESCTATQPGRVTQSHHGIVESSFCRCPWNRCLQSTTIKRDLNVGRSTWTYIFEKQLIFCSRLKKQSKIWPSNMWSLEDEILH